MVHARLYPGQRGRHLYPGPGRVGTKSGQVSLPALRDGDGCLGDERELHRPLHPRQKCPRGRRNFFGVALDPGRNFVQDLLLIRN